MSEKLTKFVDELSTLSVLEAAELVKMLEEKWGVSAAAPVAMVAGGGAAAAAEPVEEKTEFDVVIKDPGAKKIDVKAFDCASARAAQPACHVRRAAVFAGQEAAGEQQPVRRKTQCRDAAAAHF